MKNNRLSLFAMLLGILLLSPSCGIMKNVEDITDNANQILEELADLSRTVNSAVESGELEDRVGQLIDDRIDKLSETLGEIIQENGGFIFDEVNGTLDNTFDNVRTLIDDIKTGILDESIPQNIELLSSQLERHTNNVVAHAENLINLTFGNTAIIISQATDAAFTLTVWGIFGVGMILFILFLIIWGSKMSKFIRNVVLGLMAAFLLICMSILFVPPVKGLVLKSLNVGEEMIARSIAPKIVAATPNHFELGTNNQLILFGTHLENIDRDSIEIALYQSGVKKLSFPKSTIKVISANKIVLSDFAAGLNWNKVRYKQFAREYKTMTSKSLPSTYNAAAKNLNVKSIMAKPGVIQQIKKANMGHLAVQPMSQPATVAIAQPILISPALTASMNVQFAKDYGKLLQTKFKILPGDYEVKITHKRTKKALSTVQHIRFDNPPPPPPKPDVFPISVTWANGIPVKGNKGKLKVLLGVIHGEEAKSNMKVDLSANPTITGLRGIDVNRTALNNAVSVLPVYSRDFTLKKSGNHNFSISSDVSNKIQESNEGNNSKNQTLRVRDYEFKATVKWTTFTSLKDIDGFTCPDEEYRIDINTSATGHGEWKVDFNKDGAQANKNYSINKTKVFTHLKEGNKINLFTSGYEKGDCWASDENMGTASRTISIRNKSSETYTIQLRAKHYIVRGEVKYEKVLLN